MLRFTACSVTSGRYEEVLLYVVPSKSPGCSSMGCLAACLYRQPWEVPDVQQHTVVHGPLEIPPHAASA